VSNEIENPLADRLNSKLFRIAAFLFFTYLVIGSFRPMMDNVDLGWHLAQGRWMVENGSIYRHDALNYPNLGHPVVDEYPLFQIILYEAWKLGWWGPCLLTALAYGCLLGVFLRAGSIFQLEGSALLTWSLGVMMLYLQLAFPLRPHVATFLGVTILGVFLLRHREARTWIEFWPMALLQIGWTNGHSGFVLGPALVAFFGLEMVLREVRQIGTVPWGKVRVWSGAFGLILFSCLVNPFGFARFGPPFYQNGLESIRAYVSEMHPLSGGTAALYGKITWVALIVVVLAVVRARGAISFGLLLMTALLYEQAHDALKSWPLFGLCLPLLVLSSGAFSARGKRQTFGWLNLLGNFVVAGVLGCAIVTRLDGSFPSSLQVIWREYDEGRSELSYSAAAWMQKQGISGRLLHRSEDGGWLQEAGFDRGETFGDTGFGKFDENFVHLLGLLSDRPGLVPVYLKTYQPLYVVCGNPCYQWPFFLRQSGWRLIFYTSNNSVWTQAETRPDLPTVPGEKVQTIFAQDIIKNGRPTDVLLLARNIITLQSMGLEDFAFSTFNSLPESTRHAGWFWEAARVLCFEVPSLSPEHRHQLLAEAESLHDAALTSDFRAYAHEADGDASCAREILDSHPPEELSDHGADLLLQLDLDENRPEALNLAERSDCFERGDGLHWKLLAQAEIRAGRTREAASPK
jgi:hypothetical protein